MTLCLHSFSFFFFCSIFCFGLFPPGRAGESWAGGEVGAGAVHRQSPALHLNPPLSIVFAPMSCPLSPHSLHGSARWSSCWSSCRPPACHLHHQPPPTDTVTDSALCLYLSSGEGSGTASHATGGHRGRTVETIGWEEGRAGGSEGMQEGPSWRVVESKEVCGDDWSGRGAGGHTVTVCCGRCSRKGLTGADGYKCLCFGRLKTIKTMTSIL